MLNKKVAHVNVTIINNNIQEHNILSIKHVSKYFDNFKVLDDINLEVKKGDIYGVLGLSGAGKSTLVRCINGLETPDEGEIIFEGKPIFNDKTKITRDDRKKIAMIFQHFNLLSQKNVLQNIKEALVYSSIKEEIDKSRIHEINLNYYKEIFKHPLFYLLHLKKHKELRKKKNEEIIKYKHPKIFEVLKKVDLEDKWNSYPSQLSGGQKQRVAIARALITDPEIILCDEATSALDPNTTSSILKLLKELNKSLGLTIIIISHQMSVIESICNKVAVINNSKIEEKGSLNQIFLNPKTEITKKLIYSDKVNTELSKDKYIRLVFDGNVDTPLIANIVQECNILVSIVHADTKVFEDRVYGQLVMKLPCYEKDIIKLKTYLDYKKIKYEEVQSNDI